MMATAGLMSLMVSSASAAEGSNPYMAELAEAAQFIDVTNWSDDPALNADPAPGNDDTKALQALFAWVCELDDRGGGYPNRWNVKEGRYQAKDRNRVRVLFFPDGQYDVRDTLQFPTIGTKEHPIPKSSVTGKPEYLFIMGQSRDATVIRLRPGSLTDPDQPKPVISFWDGKHQWVDPDVDGVADRQHRATNHFFRNSVANLTIEIGPNNPGAAALHWECNNGATLRNLRLIDAGRSAKYGVWVRSGGAGSGYVHDVEIEGFDIGFRSSFWGKKAEFTFERVMFREQRVSGVWNEGRPFQMRQIHSVNRVPFYTAAPHPSMHEESGAVEAANAAHLILLDSTLATPDGTSTDRPALRFDAPHTHAFVRNVRVSGYTKPCQHAGQNGLVMKDGKITLWATTAPGQTELPDGFEMIDGVFGFSGHASGTAIIPPQQVKPTPEPVWETPSKWAVLKLNDASGQRRTANTSELQALIDSAAETGKTTIIVAGTGALGITEPIEVHGAVKRIYLGFCSLNVDQDALAGRPVFRIGSFDHDEPFVLEALGWSHGNKKPPAYVAIENLSDQTVVLRDYTQSWHGALYRNFNPDTGEQGTGEVFMESVVAGWGGNEHTQAQVHIKDQVVWARNINMENPPQWQPRLLVEGGQFWALGFKLGEDNGPFIDLRRCRAEMYGYLNCRSSKRVADRAAVSLTDVEALVVLVLIGKGDVPLPDGLAVHESASDRSLELPQQAMPERVGADGARPTIIHYRSSGRPAGGESSHP
jgi:hypothetical protein